MTSFSYEWWLSRVLDCESCWLSEGNGYIGITSDLVRESSQDWENVWDFSWTHFMGHTQECTRLTSGSLLGRPDGGFGFEPRLDVCKASALLNILWLWLKNCEFLKDLVCILYQLKTARVNSIICKQNKFM